MAPPDDTRARTAFERRLLDSAHEDGPPAGAPAEAWAKFAAVAGSVATHTGGDASLGGAVSRRLARSVRRTASALLVGALGGSALTVAFLTQDGPPAAPVVPARTPSSAPSSARSAPLPSASTTSNLAREEAVHIERAPRPVRVNPPPGRRADKSVGREYSLAAEVSALDGVRTALSAGAYASALHEVERYHQRFPSGALSADAEVLALEALATQGAERELRARAARFLARYPKDPHHERVRALAPRQRGD